MNRLKKALHLSSIPLVVALAWAAPTTASADPAPSKLGIGLSAGGGVTGFSDGTVNDLVDMGGTWELRATFGTRSLLAAEAAYIGNTQDFGLSIGDVGVIGSGAEGALRLNIGTFNVQPYLVGGLGWMHYSVRAGDMDFDVPADDDILTIPAGVGIGMRVGPALVDLRGTYRFAFDDELFKEEGELDDNDRFDSWSATARVGFEL